MLDLLHAVNPLPEADVYALVARMLVSVCGCVRLCGSDAGERVWVCVYALVARMLVSVCGCVRPRGSDAGERVWVCMPLWLGCW